MGFLQIVNHPVCHSCVPGFDETNGPGLINRGENALVEEGVPVIAPFMTNDQVLELVHLIKFSAYTALITIAARTIHAALERYYDRNLDSRVLIPVPMHQKQLRERGFNQAELIARVLSALLGVPVGNGILRRNRQGRRQSLTPREERPANVQGAFASRKGSLQGNHALLVDDLVTTGATALACSDELLAAGAASITVLCLGRSL